MATQGERRTLTRQALLAAAARLFAEQGVDNSSVDAIARAAGRTSGALYDHFGSKEGLLFALVDGWVDDVAVVIAAELVNAPTRREKVAALWRNFADPAVGDGRWIALEHELWSYATRSDDARDRLADRYRRAFVRRWTPMRCGPATTRARSHPLSSARCSAWRWSDVSRPTRCPTTSPSRHCSACSMHTRALEQIDTKGT